MNYQQLTQGQRYQISALLTLGFTQTEIAKTINKSKSCVSRELRRNQLANGSYDPALAHQQTLVRRGVVAQIQGTF